MKPRPITVLLLALFVVSCASPAPQSTVDSAVSPTPELTPTPQAGLSVDSFPPLESNIIPSSKPGTEANLNPTESTFPTSLADLDLSPEGGNVEQTAQYLREATEWDMDNDGKVEEGENEYDVMIQRWIANLVNGGYLGDVGDDMDRANEVAAERYQFVPKVAGKIWTVQPMEMATGRIGVAVDPETGLTYPSGMPLGVDATQFETRFTDSPAGGGAQIVASDADEQVFTRVVLDKETGKPRWFFDLNSGEFEEDPEWDMPDEVVALIDKSEGKYVWDSEKNVVYDPESGLLMGVQLPDGEWKTDFNGALTLQTKEGKTISFPLYADGQSLLKYIEQTDIIRDNKDITVKGGPWVSDRTTRAEISFSPDLQRVDNVSRIIYVQYGTDGTVSVQYKTQPNFRWLDDLQSFFVFDLFEHVHNNGLTVSWVAIPLPGKEEIVFVFGGESEVFVQLGER